jgi:hypothetical protein
MRLLLLTLLFTAAVAAQTPGRAAFQVYEKGVLVGSIEMTLTKSASGWRLQGSSRMTGSVPVTIPNLDLHYDAKWGGQFMTLEMKAPDNAIVHVAVTGTTTRTDVVRATEARFQSSSVSPDTIFVPDRAYGAYEAVAARLAGAVEGDDLPLFIAPVGETRALVDQVATEQVRTTRGVLTVKRYRVIELRDRPTTVEVWVDRGRLLRFDRPRSGISVVREDVVR